MVGVTISTLRRPLDEDRRGSLPVQIVARWGLLAVAILETNLYAGTSPLSRLALNVFAGGAVVSNAGLWYFLHRGRPIATAWAVAAGIYDVLAITGAVAVVDQFDNPNYAFYFPAFVAFTLVFPGWPSLAYMLLTSVAYIAVIAPDNHFDRTDPYEVKQLAVRISTMCIATLMANMVVWTDRRRRVRAVQRALAAHLDRERIAQEIHDSVAQEVYMLAIQLEANQKHLASQQADPALQERLAGLVRLAKHALLETRSVLFNLEPVLAGDEGLPQLLRGQAAEFTAVTGIPTRVLADDAGPRLDAAVTVQVYRVVQEALANVYKHAGPAGAEIRLRNGDASTIIEVADDGLGFDEQLIRRRGHGLANMRERAAGLGGSLTVESAPGRGTTVRLQLPVPR